MEITPITEYIQKNKKIAVPQNEDVTVRYESMGPVIWSNKKGYFYFFDEKKYQKQIMGIVENLKNENVKIDDLDLEDKFKEALIDLGFNGKIREIMSNREVGLNAPLEVYFDFTYKCNLRCSYCYNNEFLGQTTMPQEDVSKVIAEMYELGVMRIHLAGGEPTIDKEGFENYLKTAKSYGMLTSMATNGTKLEDPEIVNIILDNDIYSVTVSLDGATAEENDKFRGKGMYDKTMNGIKNLIVERDKAGSKMEVDMKPVFSTDTTNEEIENIVLLAIELGIDRIKLYNPERSLDHEQGHYFNRKDKYYEQLLFIKSLQEKYKDKIDVPTTNNPYINECTIGLPGLKGCIGAQELITVNPDGRLTPCLMDTGGLGNLKEYPSFKSFWDTSEELKKYLGIKDKPECNGCESFEACRGGCQVRTKNQDPTGESKDPLCPVDLGLELKKDNRNKDKIIRIIGGGIHSL